jgi:L-amino acid N-acyltransferase YncA
MVNVRVADAARDAPRVAEIYRPYVEQTIISFEEVAPTTDQMADRMRSTLAWTPWLVADEDGRVVGYAYATRHRERAGYRWSVDISVYLEPEAAGRGIGGALYRELLDLPRRQRFVNVYAGITLPNDASVGLHRAIGMEQIGTYERVGYKFGQWLGVTWFGMRLTEPAEPPREPIPFPELDG